MTNKSKFIVALAIIGLCACGKDDAPATAPSTQVSRALTLASTKISAAVPNTSSIAAASYEARTELTSIWTDNNYGLAGDWGTNPRNFIRNQGDKGAQSSLMHRFTQALENSCLFTTALPSTDGVVNLQTTNATITLTSTVLSQLTSVCGVASDELPPADTVVGYQVDDISAVGGSNYDRKISFDMNGGSSYTSFFYFTTTATITRFAFTEMSENNSIAIFDYSSTTGIARFEFSEGTDDGRILHYRVLLDESNDRGFYIAHAVNSGAADKVTAVVGTKEGTGTELAVSFASDMTNGAYDTSDRNACINSTTLAVATDDQLTCANGAIGANVSTFNGNIAGITKGNIALTDETDFIQFTSTTDILTAPKAF